MDDALKTDIVEAKGGVQEILDSYISLTAYTVRDYLLRRLKKVSPESLSIDVEKVRTYSRRVKVSGKRVAGSVTITAVPKTEKVAVEISFGTKDGSSVGDTVELPFALSQTALIRKIVSAATSVADTAVKFGVESKAEDGTSVEEARSDVIQKVTPSMKAAKDIKLKSGKVIPKGTSVEAIIHKYPYVKSDVKFSGFKPLYLPTALLSNYVTGFTKVPKSAALERMVTGSVAKSITGKKVEPDGVASDGSPSWLLVLGYI